MVLTTDALLQWEGTTDGWPWGEGSHFASRKTAGIDPWDIGCTVTPLIGGYTAMTAIRETLEATITAALTSSQPPGNRGFVYMADWRLNAQRDLSDANTWGTNQ